MKVAIITGSAKRVGKVIALTLAQQGYDIVVHYKNSKQEALQTAAEIKRLGRAVLVVQGDISREQDVQKIFRKIIKTFGRLDVLVNNAAVFYRTPLKMLTQKDWDVHMNTNLKGTFLCCREAVKIMQKQDSGTIINIADYAAEHPYKNYLPYCVSKAGVVVLTKALAKELAPRIKVHCISPRIVLWPEDYTEQQKKRILKTLPGKKMGIVEGVTREVVRFLKNKSL